MCGIITDDVPLEGLAEQGDVDARPAEIHHRQAGEGRREELQQQMTEWRRDFHRYPETGWMEMRTSALIANELKKIGYEVDQ